MPLVDRRRRHPTQHIAVGRDVPRGAMPPRWRPRPVAAHDARDPVRLYRPQDGDLSPRCRQHVDQGRRAWRAPPDPVHHRGQGAGNASADCHASSAYRESRDAPLRLCGLEKRDPDSNRNAPRFYDSAEPAEISPRQDDGAGSISAVSSIACKDTRGTGAQA